MAACASRAPERGHADRSRALLDRAEPVQAGVTGRRRRDPGQPEPGREVLQLVPDGPGQRAGEPDVFVDRVDPQHRGLPVGGGVELPDQAVLVEYRESEVAPATLGGRLVHLERVLEVEQLLGADTVVDEPVERRQQSRASLEVVDEVRRVDAPRPPPSTTAGSPASPTWTGSIGIALAFCRARPSEASRRSLFLRSASSTEGTATSVG